MLFSFQSSGGTKGACHCSLPTSMRQHLLHTWDSSSLHTSFYLAFSSNYKPILSLTNLLPSSLCHPESCHPAVIPLQSLFSTWGTSTLTSSFLLTPILLWLIPFSTNTFLLFTNTFLLSLTPITFPESIFLLTFPELIFYLSFYPESSSTCRPESSSTCILSTFFC